MKKIKYKFVLIPAGSAFAHIWLAKVYVGRDDLVCKELIQAAISDFNRKEGVDGTTSTGFDTDYEERKKKYLVKELKPLIGFDFVPAQVTKPQNHVQKGSSLLAIRLLHDGYPSEVSDDGSILVLVEGFKFFIKDTVPLSWEVEDSKGWKEVYNKPHLTYRDLTFHLDATWTPK